MTITITTDGNELSRLQRRAIPALLSHRRLEDAAKEANVSERTLHRWLGDPVFKEALAEAERQLLHQAVHSLASELLQDHETIISIRDDPTVTASVRLQAARAHEQSLIRWKQLAEFEQRIAAIEKEVSWMVTSMHELE